MCANVVLDTGIAPACLEYYSITTNLYWLPWFDFGNSPIISTTLMSSVSDAGKSCNDCFYQLRLPSRAQLSHLVLVV